MKQIRPAIIVLPIILLSILSVSAVPPKEDNPKQFICKFHGCTKQQFDDHMLLLAHVIEDHIPKRLRELYMCGQDRKDKAYTTRTKQFLVCQWGKRCRYRAKDKEEAITHLIHHAWSAVRTDPEQYFAPRRPRRRTHSGVNDPKLDFERERCKRRCTSTQEPVQAPLFPLRLLRYSGDDDQLPSDSQSPSQQPDPTPLPSVAPSLLPILYPEKYERAPWPTFDPPESSLPLNTASLPLLRYSDDDAFDDTSIAATQPSSVQSSSTSLLSKTLNDHADL